jgi:hypothetical protein
VLFESRMFENNRIFLLLTAWRGMIFIRIDALLP